MARRQYELTGKEWLIIEPLLFNKPRGVPRVDDRRVLNGILWRFRSGIIAKCLSERTLRADDQSRGAQRPEPLAGFFNLAPQIVAGETDTLPAHWSNMGEQGVGHVDAVLAQVAGSAVEIDDVPQDDGRDDQVEAGCSVPLVLESAVT